MGFLKDVFGGKKNSTCCDIRITEVKEQEADKKTTTAPANEAKPGGQSCCSK